MGVFSAAAVLYLVMAVGADDNDNKLTKLWSVTGSTRADGSRIAVVNVTRPITLQPRNERAAKMSPDFNPYKYAFKPRAVHLRKEERSVHYTNDKQKSEILFPGNYFPIAEEKKENLNEDASTFNPLSGGPFKPKEIPLLRYQRSFSDDEEPIIERPGAYVEQAASRRSISSKFTALFEDDEEDDEDADDADFEEDDTPDQLAKKKGKPSKIGKKYARYMLPLLLAYKMKFFTMIPLMMGGLVLLVGATGMAGFFFALFAAVMGLQKGSY